jgi:molecular chaperone DnaK (HSP70)
MKPSDLQDIFDPIVKQVIELVKGQIKATNVKIKAVLLVGGFGQSNYLKEQLRTTLGDSIEVIQPPHAWTAVVRGAVMKGLAISDKNLAMVDVKGRTARKHYGVIVGVEYDAKRHSNDEDMR